MQTIKTILLLLIFTLAAHANIPSQITNTPFAKVITDSKANGTTIAYTYGNALLSDGEHSFLADALGSTRGLADNTETLTDSYDYTSHGELASHNGTSENSFLFTGEQLDKETGNCYLRARYYSPATTRFLSRDTYDGKLIDPLSQNHYLYAGANPVMYVDPGGHFFGGGAIGMISGLFTLSNFNMITAGQASLYLPVAISAYHVKIGLQLRSEAINSITYVLLKGGTQEAIDEAYGKYYYAAKLITVSGIYVDSVNSALGWIGHIKGFSKAITDYHRANNILESYRNLSSILFAKQCELMKMSNNFSWLRSNTPAITDTISDMSSLIIELTLGE